MKFTCDRCSAQYMISDEKVGPSGVKVRCKKCGHVIVVRRAAEKVAEAPAATAPETAAAAGNGGGGNGLDAELGQAFDTAFGDAPAQPAADLAATQAMSPEDAARIPAAPAPASPAPTEWYVAIGQAQVGPLPLAEVKRKWEGGEVGPDSLVWRPGMGDWKPLSSVAELAGYLAPVPRAPAPAPRVEMQPFRAEPQPGREAAAAAPAATQGDVTWKPVGASALAALANEEIATRSTPEPKPAARAAAPSGAKSLVDGLPDSGGVDPTGAIPLSIKGLETTAEKKIEQRRSSIASRAEETRHKRSVMRAVVIGVVVVVAVVGGAAAYLLSQMKKIGGAPATPVAIAPRPPVPPAPAVAPPAPAPPAPAPAAAAAAPAPGIAAAAPAQPPAPAPGAAPPAPPPPAEKAAPGHKVAKGEPARTSRKDRREALSARANAPAPAPGPAPAPVGKKKKDGLLDFDSSDSALDDALSGGGSGRSVYVPPARAGAAALPDKLTAAQINESVAGRIDALRKCVSEQKARDPGASGVLRMRWVIGGDGAVREVKALTGEFASSPFAQCITGVVKSTRFPKSATPGQEVTFPFSF